MYKKPNRESQNCAKASNVRKTILRNPEKPLLYNETNKIPASNLQDKLKTKTQPVEPNSNRFHDPKFNKIKELESKLNDCKLNDPLFAQTKLTIEQSRTVANREISSKLNFSTNQPVFKNLTRLYENEAAHQMIQKSTKKIEKSRKSSEARDEVDELLKRLVSLETDTKFKTPMLVQCHSENDFLGMSKFLSPNCLVSNKRYESLNYIDLLQSDVTEDFVCFDEYFNTVNWRFPPENNRSSSTCKCLQDFYNQQSKCS